MGAAAAIQVRSRLLGSKRPGEGLIAVGISITGRPPHRTGTCGIPAYGSHLGV